MIKHVVMWKLREGTEAQRDEVVRQMRALQGVVPQLLKSQIGVNVGAADNYDLALITEFNNLDDLQAYKVHPKHQAAAKLVTEIATSRVAVDYEF